jgi:hypothetical protein
MYPVTVAVRGSNDSMATQDCGERYLGAGCLFTPTEYVRDRNADQEMQELIRSDKGFIGVS